MCHLIEELGCGKVVEGAVDNYPVPLEPWTVDVRVDRVCHVIGEDIPKEEMKDIFLALEMEVEDAGDVLKVTPPTIRLDLAEEIDFIEEVARIHGYDKLPLTLPKGSSRAGEPKSVSINDLACSVLTAMGADEVKTYSFVSPQDPDRIRLPEDAWERDAVTLINPLGEENSVMRTMLTPSILEVLGRNYSMSNDQVRIFEIGEVFEKNIYEAAGLPEESDNLCIGLYGKGNDFFLLKGMVTGLLGKLGIDDVRFIAESGHGAFHPGRCARFVTGDERDPIELGIMGEIHPDVAETYGIGTRACVCEMFFGKVQKIARTDVRYTPLPRYPAVTRDIAVTVSEQTAVGDMRSEIIKTAGELLEDVRLFDIYRGEQIEDGKKSVAFSLTYRDREKTLTDAEVQVVHEKVVLALKDEFDAVLREI